MSTQDESWQDTPYGVFVDEDLIDDSTGVIPTKRLGIPLSLKDRFIRRLSKVIGATANIREVPDGKAIDIFLTRSRQSTRSSIDPDERLRKFVRELEDTLAKVATYPSGRLYPAPSLRR